MIYSWFQQTRTICYKGLKVLKLSLSILSVFPANTLSKRGKVLFLESNYYLQIIWFIHLEYSPK